MAPNALANTPSTPRALFGGAIVATLPSRFVDVSDVRQIPDNQEVFLDGNTDQSYIFELLDLAVEAQATEAAAFHFRSIAHDNDAVTLVEESSTATVELPRPHQGTLSRNWGLQTVAKFKEGAEAANQIRVHVACFRLNNVETDLVMSMNAPVAINAASSTAEAPTAIMDPEQVLAEFLAVSETVEVKDYSLFG